MLPIMLTLKYLFWLLTTFNLSTASTDHSDVVDFNTTTACVGHDHTPVFGPSDQLLFIIEEDQPNGDVIIFAKNILRIVR